MKKRLVLMALLAILGIGSETVWAGINAWTSLGPEGASIRALAIDQRNSSTVYAATSGAGVFKSTDGGKSWRTVNSARTMLDVRILVIDPQETATLYAGTHNDSDGLFKSADGGATWSGPDSALNAWVYALAIDPQKPSMIYAGTWGGGVSKSTDGGANWIAGQNGLNVVALAIDPKTSTIYAATYGFGVQKTTDGGMTWNGANSGLPTDAANRVGVSILVIDQQNPSSLYAVAWAPGAPESIFTSTDGAESWTAVTGLPTTSVGSLAMDPKNSGALYAGTVSGVYAITFAAPVLLSLSGDGKGQGAILHAGTPQVASSSNPASAGEALEIYCTGLGEASSIIPPEVTIGGRLAQVLYFGNAPGLSDMNQVNVRVPSGVAPGPTAPVRLTYIGRPSNEVTIAVR